MIRQSKVIDNRSGDFQLRTEAAFAWKTAVAALQDLPGLRGLWTMGSFDSSGYAYDMSGQGRTLTYTSSSGWPHYGQAGLAPYVDLNGALTFLWRADEAGLDITGTEAYVETARMGLTMGCWVYPRLVATQQCVMGKWNTTSNQRSYNLQLLAGNVFQADVSSAGTAGTVRSVASTVAVSVNNWYFVCLAFNPSARLAINVNGTVIAVTSSVPASIHPGTARFTIGPCNDGALLPLTGRVSLAFLTCMYYEETAPTPVTDRVSQAIFQHTRGLFGV